MINKLSGTILIVDDLLENLQVLDQMLRNEGYKVKKATNGKMALRTCQSSLPDLILLDIKMPEMDGYEVCQQLKNNPDTQDIPIIFISALNEVFDKVKGFEVGGIDYITKPFQEAEVIARIKSQLTIQQQKKSLQAEIEKRTEMEKIIYQSRALFASVLNSSLDGIAAMESVRDKKTGEIIDFSCLIVNPVIARKFGKSEIDFIGKFIVKQLLHQINPNLFAKFVEVVETGKPLQQDICYNENNCEYWYHCIAVKLGDGFAVTIIDITDQKNLEFYLEEINQELKAFNYSVAHDIRNPLSNINLSAYFLKERYRKILDQQGLNYLEEINMSSKRIENIISDLLAFAQIKELVLLYDNINLTQMVTEIFTQLKNSQPERQLELMIHSDIIVQADQRFMKIALDNLIGNAWKYTSRQEKGIIEFGVLSEDDEIYQQQLKVIKETTNFKCQRKCQGESLFSDNNQKIYFIKDNGVGFNMEKADQVFNPFKRLHGGEEFEGTGLGLSIVERIIKRHGGLIWCYSEVNQGTVFYFTIPD
jgi:signal transduction histidine kinase/DNA-binding response OmpR family regulator